MGITCENCRKLKGDSTTFFNDFLDFFIVLYSVTTSMTETGKAQCQTCKQLVDFDYNEMLIPKLRVEFI
jgi:hypothetical protein